MGTGKRTGWYHVSLPLTFHSTEQTGHSVGQVSIQWMWNKGCETRKRKTDWPLQQTDRHLSIKIYIFSFTGWGSVWEDGWYKGDNWIQGQFPIRTPCKRCGDYRTTGLAGIPIPVGIQRAAPFPFAIHNCPYSAMMPDSRLCSLPLFYGISWKQRLLKKGLALKWLAPLSLN